MKLNFIHIPKTAGTYIKKCYGDQINYFGHTFFITFKNQSKNLEKY